MIRQLCYLSIFIASATAADIELSLDRADEHVLSHNPALTAARVRIEEARGRFRQAGRPSNPELEIEYSKNVRSPENAFAILFIQRFPVTARLRLEKAVSQAELAAAEAEVRNQERIIVGEARLIIVKLLGLRGQRTLRERQIGNSRELAEFTRKRVQTAEASVVEATQVDLDVAQLNAELNKVLANPEVREFLVKQGMNVGGGTREAFAAQVARDRKARADIIRDMKIVAE
jgi:cobalt-zinc-cadmium efflux system outer membrane protein